MDRVARRLGLVGTATGSVLTARRQRALLVCLLAAGLLLVTGLVLLAAGRDDAAGLCLICGTVLDLGALAAVRRWRG